MYAHTLCGVDRDSTAVRETIENGCFKVMDGKAMDGWLCVLVIVWAVCVRVVCADIV